ncbi:protein gar2-like [Nicotiana sylvestris]|uniref:protein gar2-like n=1 Tax=Nicotiana sylvestris TaxID=4096 RepID=UPI00388CE842
MSITISQILSSPINDKPQVEESTVETNIETLDKRVDATNVMPMVEGEGNKEPVQKEAFDGLSFRRMRMIIKVKKKKEKKSKNEEDYGEDKESETEDRIDEQVDDFAEEENNSEEEGDYESEGGDQEKASESEGEDEESEEENENSNGESEGSMTIGNTVIAPSEEVSGEKRTEEIWPLLTPSTGDKEVSSDKDNLPLYELGKKTRKTHIKATKSDVPTRKEVAPPARTPLTRSKIKAIDK